VIVLSIDPGTVRSAWLAFDTTAGRPMPDFFGIVPNAELLEVIRNNRNGWVTAVVIEQVVSYGMPIGETTIETVHWAGRFAEAAYPTPVYRVPRLAVRMALCHSGRAKDPNVRAALLDRFGGDAAIGRKAHPGPLYGFKADLFAALGVAVTWADMLPDDRAAARLP
jgi:hypothetical protein